jgi:hypothetical protein
MPTSVHLHIEEPCHENWQQMTPNEQGRHCLSCQKTVVDFTLMSDQEILNHISHASSSTCGRFTNDQLNKTYTERKVKPAFTFRYAWNVLVATFLLTGSAATAQSKKSSKKKEPIGQQVKKISLPRDIIMGAVMEAPARIITGTVIDDSTGLPIGFASVRIKGIETGTSANDTGYFRITVPGKNDMVTIIVSAIGYEDNEFEVPVYGFKKYKVMMAQEAELLKPVEVKGVMMGKVAPREAPPIPERGPIDFEAALGGVVGGVTVVSKVNKVEKIKREVKDWLSGKKDVRIYPNPVLPGNAVNISLQLNKTGDYKLELMDASGRVVHIQALQIAQQQQVINIPTQSSWSRGTYWIRISGATDKKVYQAKLLLQ